MLCAKMGTCFPWCNSRVRLRSAFEMSCWSRLRVSVNASVFAWIAEDYLRTLITTAKNGGHKGLKDAVEYRLRALRARDRGGLFEWVDADSSAAGGHGHFVILLRHDAVDVIRQHGTEIFIDRWDTKVTNPPSLSRVTDRNHVLLTACSWFWCLHSTHCTTRRVKGHQDLQLYNILVRDRGGHGVVVASFYLERHDANTVSAALEHIVRWLYEKHRVVWDVNMSMQDDSAVERAAVSKVWPRAQIRLCVWHIAHRNVQAKLTGYFSLSFALVVVKVVWDLVRRGGHRACKAPVEILCDAVDFFAAKLAGLGMMPAIHEGNKYHPQEVKRRLRTGESAPCQPPPPLHMHASLRLDGCMHSSMWMCIAPCYMQERHSYQMRMTRRTTIHKMVPTHQKQGREAVLVLGQSVAVAPRARESPRSRQQRSSTFGDGSTLYGRCSRTWPGPRCCTLS